MTTSIWTGPGGTGGHPRSGHWEDAASWSGGAVPAKDADVTFAPGNYTVTLSKTGYEVGAMNIGSGVTVDTVDLDTSKGFVVVAEDSNNFGTLHTTGSFFLISSGVTLYNFGVVYGCAAKYLGEIVGAGTLDNQGAIYSTPGSVFVLDVNTTNEAGGVIDTRGGGELAFFSGLTNNGLVSAVDGGFVAFSYGSNNGATTNLSGGTLTGGQWSAIGASSTLEFYDANGLDTFAAGTVVTLSGQGSFIGVDDTAGNVTALEDTLRYINDGATFKVLGGRGFASSQNLDVDGMLQLGGGTLSSDGMTVHDDATSSLAGFGLVTSDIDLYGALRADRNKDNANLTLTGHNTIYNSGALIGRGTLEIAGGVDDLREGAQLLVKSLLISGGELDIHDDLVFGNKLAMKGSGAMDLGNHILRLTGQVDLSTSVITNGQLQLEGGDMTLHDGWAQIIASLRNNGVVNVDGGVFLQAGQVNGVGAFHVAAGALVEFGSAVSAGQTVSLDGAGAKLTLFTATTFKGVVDGFGSGDTIDFLKFAPAGASVGWKSDADGGGGDLTVTSGGQSATIHLDGDYRRSQFHLFDDNHGGTEVLYGINAAGVHGEVGWDMHGGLAI